MRSRSDVLETAVLGLLNESPLHGYELRKRLNLVLGSFRALSYGTLYPALKSLVARGLIATAESEPSPSARKAKPGIPGRTTKPKPLGRRRVVYELTHEGKEHLQTVLASAGPAAWEDDNFDVRFALFAQTDAETRLRVLEGRRTRLTERLEAYRESTAHPRSRLDEYALELRRFGLEKVEREVRWLDGLISTERGRAAAQNRPSSQEQPKKEPG
ncbi:PadR family transcriptional regulator [Promicromonospora citrea]|uniref:PadR family transcriptional regulator n=1 Tax=Promicromonospora citrea TaxID=43677 RepID=A0A8H9L372_9MICO|nr:PadR family transcriptional regulator [Promicromonospora citrea]NNH52431.1 PadR family transcriptional regulator [Promicromonospora citrea]GGM10873.1 PadR family transcriptional regulator [Promicromonospora citrea]